MPEKEKTFYFLEGFGTLLWVLMDVSWLFEVGSAVILFASLAVAGNLFALIYAIFRLDRDLVPIKAVVAYNLWVIMGALWAIGEFQELDKLVLAARITGLALILVTVWEFTVNRNNSERMLVFMKFFRKFRIR
ncbi:MAG: hypothetical protein Q8R55_06740 [Candidatus Taylorbacteria bacterium]|nr:hypothetical protein [Candidatus Taylorbacteria bacterium]